MVRPATLYGLETKTWTKKQKTKSENRSGSERAEYVEVLFGRTEIQDRLKEWEIKLERPD